MATIVLSAAGAALGSAVGGTFLGLSMTAVGRFVGASIGTVGARKPSSPSSWALSLAISTRRFSMAMM